MGIMSDYKLWCWNKCPYAQRAWTAFLKSDVDFEYIEINPYENRDNVEWRAVSPEGKVPVVQSGSMTPGINESLVTMELISDLAEKKYAHTYYWPNNMILPQDPIEKAKARLQAAKYDKIVTKTWYGYLTGMCEEDKFTAGLKQFLSEFSSSAPFFGNSKTIGFVDLAIQPWLSRMQVMHVHKQYKLAEKLTKEEFEKFKTWIKAVNADENVKKTIPDFYETANMYGKYAVPVGYKEKTKEEIDDLTKDFHF